MIVFSRFFRASTSNKNMRGRLTERVWCVCVGGGVGGWGSGGGEEKTPSMFQSSLKQLETSGLVLSQRRSASAQTSKKFNEYSQIRKILIKINPFGLLRIKNQTCSRKLSFSLTASSGCVFQGSVFGGATLREGAVRPGVRCQDHQHQETLCSR